MREIEDPTRSELREIFQNMAPADRVMFRRYPRNRINNWMTRYGIKGSVRQQEDGGFLVTCRERLVGEAQTKGPSLRERMDRLVVDGALVLEPDEYEEVVRAIRLFHVQGAKGFETRAVEEGLEVVRKL